MSYIIQYNPDLNKKYPKQRIHKQLPMKQLVIFFVICVVAYIFAHYGWYKFLLPGDADVTAAAVSALIARIGEGASVKEAVHSFCEDIITANTIQ